MGSILGRVKGLELERLLGLRPPYPAVAVAIDRGQLVIVRVKRRRRGLPLLEAQRSDPLPDGAVPPSIFKNSGISTDELATRLRELFERSGTRPGKVSLVIPDNLAKISLLTLPERPASPTALHELVRSQMRRAIPFRIEDASLTYQVLSGRGQGVSVLVALVRKALVGQYEKALGSIGARVGLIDLCTPNVINLCRGPMAETMREGADVALLNCAANYFSLAIMRDDRLIFLRCKTYATGAQEGNGPNGALFREVNNSLSYYREKLEGQGVRTLFVRSATAAPEEIGERLSGLDIERVVRVDPATSMALENGSTLEPGVGQQIAPAVGAAMGRGR